MKRLGEILVSGIVGTFFMTAYIVWKSKQELQLYLQPVLLNKMIDREKSLPTIPDKLMHPAGWVLHFGAGISFVAVYWLIWKKSIKNLSFGKILLIGFLSGIIGILMWKTMLEEHPRPPANDRVAYYKHLLISHLIFSMFAIYTFKEFEKRNTSPLLEF